MRTPIRILNYGFNPRSHKGATPMKDVMLQNYMVSIHAPIRERLSLVEEFLPVQCFNPRSHKGATRTLVIDTIDWAVSIHAPIRERR